LQVYLKVFLVIIDYILCRDCDFSITICYNGHSNLEKCHHPNIYDKMSLEIDGYMKNPISMDYHFYLSLFYYFFSHVFYMVRTLNMYDILIGLIGFFSKFVGK